MMTVAKDYPFLYRGQDKEYDSVKCLPTLYRGNPTDEEIFLERMRFIEFKKLLNSHPIVSGFYMRHGFNIDYEGLAQHYGLKTEVLDFTDDLDTALFFAMCPYDASSDTYRFYNDGAIHNAILYLIRPVLD